MNRERLECELERLHPAAFSWALGCCGRNRTEAEDVLQDSYLKILDGRARFDGRSSVKTFLFAVVRRTAAEARRRRWLRGLALAGRPRDPIQDESAASDRRLLLAGAFAKLARRQRQVLELVFGHGLTIEEAARVLGVSLGSARVHYSRGKRRLEKLLRG